MSQAALLACSNPHRVTLLQQRQQRQLARVHQARVRLLRTAAAAAGKAHAALPSYDMWRLMLLPLLQTSPSLCRSINALLLLRLVAHTLADSSSQPSGKSRDFFSCCAPTLSVYLSLMDLSSRCQCLATGWSSCTEAPAAQVSSSSAAFRRRNQQRVARLSRPSPPFRPQHFAAPAAGACHPHNHHASDPRDVHAGG